MGRSRTILTAVFFIWLAVVFLSSLLSSLPKAAALIAGGRAPGPEQRPTSVQEGWRDGLMQDFAFRMPLASTYSAALVRYFRSSVSPSLLVGRDGWYFLRDSSVRRVMDQRYGPDDSLVDPIRIALTELDHWSRATGRDVLFLVVPEKNTVLPEYLPASWQRPGQSVGQVAVGELMSRGNGTAVDLFEVFRTSSRRQALYFRTDAHWTHEGVARAYEEIAGSPIFRRRALDYRPKLIWRPVTFDDGDAGRLLNLPLSEPTRVFTPAGGYRAREARELIPTYLRHQASTFSRVHVRRRPDSVVESRMFFRGDSFGLKLFQLMAEGFAQSMFVNPHDYWGALPEQSAEHFYAALEIEAFGADLVVLQFAERWLLDRQTTTLPASWRQPRLAALFRTARPVSQHDVSTRASGFDVVLPEAPSGAGRWIARFDPPAGFVGEVVSEETARDYPAESDRVTIGPQSGWLFLPDRQPAQLRLSPTVSASRSPTVLGVDLRWLAKPDLDASL